MLRRRFLKQLAAAAAATASAAPRAADAHPLKVGVVGAGILGASIAYHLAHAGARVTVFEKGEPAGGATQNSFAWLNAFVADPDYRALRLKSLAAYHELDARLGLGLLWGGYASWAGSGAEVQGVRDSARQLAGTAYPVRPIDAQQLAALARGLDPGPVAEAFYSRIDGHLDPKKVTLKFIEAARRRGAQLMRCEVLDIERSAGALLGVRTSLAQVPLDRLIVAGGVDTPTLLASVGFALRLRHAPGILAHSRPTAIVTPVIFDAPGTLSFKQMADGSIVGTDSPEPPETAAHRAIRAQVMDFPDAELRALHGNRILGKIGHVLAAARGVPLQRLTLGFRPMPEDELPIVGALPGLAEVHIAVTHSGVTLAPILGRYVAEEVLRGTRVPDLAPFRPERFGGAAA